VGEGSCNGEGCSDSWQTDAIASCAEKDRCCAKGAMGKSEGRKENGLRIFLRWVRELPNAWETAQYLQDQSAEGIESTIKRKFNDLQGGG
jgi:hypothetical protein